MKRATSTTQICQLELSLDALPSDVLSVLCSYMPPNDLLFFSLICQKIRVVVFPLFKNSMLSIYNDNNFDNCRHLPSSCPRLMNSYLRLVSVQDSKKIFKINPFAMVFPQESENIWNEALTMGCDPADRFLGLAMNPTDDFLGLAMMQHHVRGVLWLIGKGVSMGEEHFACAFWKFSKDSILTILDGYCSSDVAIRSGIRFWTTNLKIKCGIHGMSEINFWMSRIHPSFVSYDFECKSKFFCAVFAGSHSRTWNDIFCTISQEMRRANLTDNLLLVFLQKFSGLENLELLSFFLNHGFGNTQNCSPLAFAINSESAVHVRTLMARPNLLLSLDQMSDGFIQSNYYVSEKKLDNICKRINHSWGSLLSPSDFFKHSNILKFQ